ncbi:MAG: ATP-binding protein [Sulfolobaceae archaeon]|nr:ATP-binding protein [Sulfolobaceae archaeon]
MKFLSFFLSLPYLLILHNYIAFLGSIFAGIFILLFASVYEIPLVLASWIALPFIYEIGIAAGTEIKTSESICIGKVEAVLERSPTQALSRIPLRSLKYSWRQKSYNYCINFETLKNYNVAIVGTSGSGKSHLAKLIIDKLNTSFLVFDPHGEYEIPSAVKIDASKIKINPLSLLGESPRQRALEVAYMIKSVFNLGNIQTFEFYNLLLDAYTLKGIFDSNEETWKYDPPTFYDVYSILQKRKSSALSSNELNKYSSLEPYVSFLANEVFASNSINMEDLIDKNVIIDLSKVPTTEIRYIIIETILRGIYSYLYSKGKSKLWKIVIMDESPFVLSKDTGKDIVVKLTAEGRKFGLGIMLISQSSKLLKEILPNISLFYAFATVEPSELEYTSKFLSGSDEEEYKAIYETLQKLDRGVMITKDIYKNSVILVRLSGN